MKFMGDILVSAMLVFLILGIGLFLVIGVGTNESD